MKNKLYKLTSILLSLTLVCSMFAILPTKAFAAEVDNDNVSANADEVSADVDDNSVSSAETFTSGDYKYTKNDDGTVTISEYLGSYMKLDDKLEIPSTIDGYTVTSIGCKAFEFAFQDLKWEHFISIIIPDTVTSIQNRAFGSCLNIRSLSLPNSLITIGDDAFENCTSLKSLTIPDSVTEIGEGAFNSCYDMEYATISNNLKVIPDRMFEYCSSIVSIDIPDSVTEIGEGAFYECYSLTNITTSKNLKAIYDEAFALCENLTSIDIPDGVTYIGASAFNGCKSLTSINLSDNLESIEESTFYDCNNLMNVTLPKNLLYIHANAFWKCYRMESITFPDCLVSIDDKAFGETNLQSVTIPRETYINIWEDPFYNNLNPEMVIYGYRRSSANSYAMSRYIPFYPIDEKPFKLTYLEDGSAEIKLCNFDCGDYNQYYGCYPYSNTIDQILTVPEKIDRWTITSIGDYSFNYGGFRRIYLPKTLTKIGYKVFDDSYMEPPELVVPDSVTYMDDDIGNVAVIICNKDSYANKYSVEHNIKYRLLNTVAGDTDLDGKVDIKDATRLQMAISGVLDNDLEYTLMDNFNDVADLNKDEKSDVNDVTLIQKMIAVYAAK